jgi:LPS sulfotransferase NodH
MSSNGISGIKLHYYQFADLPRRMRARPGWGNLSPGEVVSAMFPDAKYVWLKRRDKVRQAISAYLASETAQWWSIDGSAVRDGQHTADDVKFDTSAIAGFQTLLEQNDRGWQAFFESNQLTPLVIEYEDLASDYVGTIQKVLQWLGIPDPERASIRAPRLCRQSDARSDEWAARYTALTGGQPDSLLAAPVNPADFAVFTPPSEPFAVIPDAWKRWVAHARLLGYSTDAITEVLIANGYSSDAAHAEANKAASDPYLLGSARHQQRMNKAAALLRIQGQLRRLDSRVSVVERRAPLSVDEFRDRYYAANRPVIIEGLLVEWKALTEWTPDYLKRVAGQNMVEAMTGRCADPRYEINARRHRTQMRFDTYIDMVYSGKVTNDYYMTANNLFFQRANTRKLLNDLRPLPHQYLKPSVDGRQCFLWFGPAGTVTPLHHDTMNTLIAQVVGRKRFRLVPPQHWQYLYNNVGVFSDVDCETPDLAKHPEFRHANMADIVLEPGEALFMPVGWWHHERALDVSMTVTFTNFIYPNRFTWEQTP